MLPTVQPQMLTSSYRGCIRIKDYTMLRGETVNRGDHASSNC